MKKIGIVTSVRELNYGAILQAFALQTMVSQWGYDVRLLWWSNQKNLHRDIRLKKIFSMIITYIRNPQIIKKSVNAYGHTFKKKISEASIILYERFEDKFLKINFLTYAQMKKFAASPDCKALIAGSDQIWNSYAIYVDPFYYLRFAPREKRVAYAPSLGKNDIPDYNKVTIEKYISEFHRISVREKSSKKLLEKSVSKKIFVALDPTFLLTCNEWRKIEKDIMATTEYILLYFLDRPDEKSMSQIKSLLEKIKFPIFALPYRMPCWNVMGNVKYVNAGPAEFLSLIDNAKLVITDSFHGTVFSIIFNKIFYTFDRQYGNNQSQVSRITDLLNLLGLSDRFIGQGCLLKNSEINIDYTEINRKLENLREESKRYLKEAINSCGQVTE
ncbi:MAG: polysaccharide pyruvyl transferase family protein [Hungatella sp.]|nr:polysaccharide pyruvyl transferase family protein [Hungatella sp.]